MPNTPYILAVDGGGTKTTVWVCDQKGEKISESRGGAMSLAATSEKKAVEHFLEVVRDATKNLDSPTFSHIMIGLAGVDTPFELEHAKKLFSEALMDECSFDSFELVNDTVIALASGTESPDAIVLISGTGSNCFGRRKDGRTTKAGGMDFLLSDQGSGYDIGQKVLRNAVKSFDGRGKKTIMEELLCEHFEIASIAELKDKVYHPQLNKTQIAQLASICFAAHKQMDTIANEILSDAIVELMEMVTTVVRKLDLAKTDTDLVLIGGIATDPYIKSQLKLRLRTHYPKLHLKVPEHPAVYGALQMALQR